MLKILQMSPLNMGTASAPRIAAKSPQTAKAGEDSQRIAGNGAIKKWLTEPTNNHFELF